MAKVRYAVVHTGEEWRVIGERACFGRFADPDRAVEAGAGLARAAAASDDLEVEFLVQDEVGRLRPHDVVSPFAPIDADAPGAAHQVRSPSSPA